MTRGSESDSPSKAPPPIEPYRPGRGAFPRPKSELEKARPYVPDNGEEIDDSPEGKSEPPTYGGRQPEGCGSGRGLHAGAHIQLDARRVTCLNRPRSVVRCHHLGVR